MRTNQTVRLLLVSLTCAFLLWAVLLWLLPALQTVRANPGSLFVKTPGIGIACTQAQPCGLQTALGKAVNGDNIYVAAGTYTGSGDAVVTITKSIDLYGGWDGAASGPIARDPDRQLTVLDGEDERRVIYITGTVTVGIDGFTIQNGYAGVAPRPGRGGGIYSYGGAPLIVNNIISANLGSAAGTGLGGGIYAEAAAEGATIRENLVIFNAASYAGNGFGGGIQVIDSPETWIIDNTMVNNSACITKSHGWGGAIGMWTCPDSVVSGNWIEANAGTEEPDAEHSGRGAGMYIEEGDGLEVANNTIVNNSSVVTTPSYGSGGGLWIGWTRGATISGNLIEGNAASASPEGGEGGGGGVLMYKCTATLDGNRVLGNVASQAGYGSGGGLEIENDTAFTMTNNIVVGNHANDFGGGLTLLSLEGYPVIGILLHNTFVGNNLGSGYGQAAIHLSGDWIQLDSVNDLFATHSNVLCGPPNPLVTISRPLIWDNTDGDLCDEDAAAIYDAVTQDPLLDENYRLTAESPAIDAADCVGVEADIDGDPRPIGDWCDIGADEYAVFWQVYLPTLLRKR